MDRLQKLANTADSVLGNNEDEDTDLNEAEPVPVNPPVFAEDGLDFGFAGYVVSIDNMDVIDHKGGIVPPKNDTCRYDMELGEHMINVPLRISPTGNVDFVAFEVYERAVYHYSISNEGPHCDMIEMDPVYSPWAELDIITPDYSWQTMKWDAFQNPEVDVSDEDFKAITLEHCGEHYANLLDEEWMSSSAKDHLGTSGYEIKIVATKMDGTQHISYIILSSPMGC